MDLLIMLIFWGLLSSRLFWGHILSLASCSWVSSVYQSITQFDSTIRLYCQMIKKLILTWRRCFDLPYSHLHHYWLQCVTMRWYRLPTFLSLVCNLFFNKILVLISNYLIFLNGQPKSFESFDIPGLRCGSSSSFTILSMPMHYGVARACGRVGCISYVFIRRQYSTVMY